MPVLEALAAGVGVRTACDVLGVPRSSRYAAPRPRGPQVRAPAPPPRALSGDEKVTVRETLNSERFADQAPREVYATLLDEGKYLCSVASMYRILRENAEVRERRNQLRHPTYAKPVLLATGPNQVWTWDTLAPALQVQVSASRVIGMCGRWRSRSPAVSHRRAAGSRGTNGGAGYAINPRAPSAAGMRTVSQPGAAGCAGSGSWLWHASSRLNFGATWRPVQFLREHR